MRRSVLAASIAAAALMPSAALADTQSHRACEEKSSTRAIATVGGAGVGGVLGNVIAGQGDKTLGTIIGAVGGAILGNQVAKSGRDCDDAYGYYDSDSRWHASGVGAEEATGYYDRDGSWIEGAPNGRYGDDGRWMVNSGATSGEGYTSAQGEWVPASVNGYYDRNDEWVRGSDNGYYDSRGRWIASVAPVQPDRRENAYGYYDSLGQWHANGVTERRPTGYYDRNDNWVQGRPDGHYDQRGNWIPLRDDGTASGSYDSQNRWIPAASNGYYDSSGQWHAGTATGYYDSRGSWVSTVAETGAMRTRSDRPALVAQLSSLDRQLVDAREQRTLSSREFARLKREVTEIRSREDAMAHDRQGNVSARNEVLLQSRIDRLNDLLRTTTLQ